jgi:hypothetical protein
VHDVFLVIVRRQDSVVVSDKYLGGTPVWRDLEKIRNRGADAGHMGYDAFLCTADDVKLIADCECDVTPEEIMELSTQFYSSDFAWSIVDLY